MTVLPDRLTVLRLIDQAVRAREKQTRFCSGCKRHLPPDAFDRNHSFCCACQGGYRRRRRLRQELAA